EAVRSVLDGGITHAPTCVLLLKAALRVGTGRVEPEERAVVQMAGPGGPRRRSRVVVIEDNRDAAESLRMLLETQGGGVAGAHAGRDGIAAARDVRPDVVFVDIALPGLDGYEVARRLRSEWGGHRLVLVALTAYGGEEARRRAEAAGFDLHFVKPADPAVLAALFKDVHARGATADPVI